MKGTLGQAGGEPFRQGEHSHGKGKSAEHQWHRRLASVRAVRKCLAPFVPCARQRKIQCQQGAGRHQRVKRAHKNAPGEEVTNTAVGPSAPPICACGGAVPAQGRLWGRKAYFHTCSHAGGNAAAAAARTARASPNHKKRQALPLYCPAKARLKGAATASAAPCLP